MEGLTQALNYACQNYMLGKVWQAKLIESLLMLALIYLVKRLLKINLRYRKIANSSRA